MYIVSGFRRTGTSAMMRAIAHNAPLVLAYSDRIAGNKEHDGYAPNPNGLYELGGRTSMSSTMRKLNQRPRVLVKIFFDYVCNIPKGNHKIIFMVRDPDEIQRSVRKVQEHFDNLGLTLEQPWPENQKTFDRYRPYCQDDIDHVLGILEMRQDVELVIVDYNELIADPVSQMKRVADLVPELEPYGAARMIDKSLYRIRHECDRKIPDDRLSA